MYDPDDVATAQRELAEQRAHEEADAAQVLAGEIFAAKTTAGLAERDGSVTGATVRIERRLGPPAAAVLLNGSVMVVCRRYHYTDADDELMYGGEYVAAPDQTALLALVAKAAQVKRHDWRDPLKYKLDKWIDYNENESIVPPENLTLRHQFRDGRKVFSCGDSFVVEATYPNDEHPAFHWVRLSDIARAQEGLASLEYSIECAVRADLEYQAGKAALQTLRQKLGLSQSDDIAL